MIRDLLRRRRGDITLIVDLPSAVAPAAVDDIEAWVTRLVREQAADRAETSSGGAAAAVPSPAASVVGEPAPPGDTIAQAAVAEAALNDLAQALAHVAIPGASVEHGTPAFRSMYRRYADAVLLAGWRPPADKIEELA